MREADILLYLMGKKSRRITHASQAKNSRERMDLIKNAKACVIDNEVAIIDHFKAGKVDAGKQFVKRNNVIA